MNTTLVPKGLLALKLEDAVGNNLDNAAEQYAVLNNRIYSRTRTRQRTKLKIEARMG